MAERVLSAVKVGPKQTELREFSVPDIPTDAGLLKVEAAGICGSDVNSYPRPIGSGPHIMGTRTSVTSPSWERSLLDVGAARRRSCCPGGVPPLWPL